MTSKKPSDGEFVAFRDQCVFLRSLSRHQQILFEHRDLVVTQRMKNIANIFFGDLNRLLVSHIILQVCCLTDPPKDAFGNESLTIDFLMKHYALQSETQLITLRDRLMTFRTKVKPARNKLISHSDRKAVVADAPLGAASNEDWRDFWSDLDDFLHIAGKHILDDDTFRLDDVAQLSDADGLLKALEHAQFFDELLDHKDVQIAHASAELLQKPSTE